MTVEFTAYTREGLWSRTVTNILAFLGNVGGISQVLVGTVFNFIYPISNHSVIINAISALYILKKSSSEKLFDVKDGEKHNLFKKMEKNKQIEKNLGVSF
jgi:hypothetical protein